MIPPTNPIYTTLVTQLEALPQGTPILTRTHVLALKAFLNSKEILSQNELSKLQGLLKKITPAKENYNASNFFNRLASRILNIAGTHFKFIFPYVPTSQERAADLYRESLERINNVLDEKKSANVLTSSDLDVKADNSLTKATTETSLLDENKPIAKKSILKISTQDESSKLTKSKLQHFALNAKELVNWTRSKANLKKLTDISFNILQRERGAKKEYASPKVFTEDSDTSSEDSSVTSEIALSDSLIGEELGMDGGPLTEKVNELSYAYHAPHSTNYYLIKIAITGLEKTFPTHPKIEQLQTLLEAEEEIEAKKENSIENTTPALKTILQIFSETNLLFLGEIITDFNSKECLAILSTIENNSELKNLLSTGEKNLIESIKTIKLSDSKDILTLRTEELDLSKKCTETSKEGEQTLLPDTEQKLTTLLSKKNTYSGFYTARYAETLLLEAQNFFTKQVRMAGTKTPSKIKTSKYNCALLSQRLDIELFAVTEALEDT